MIRTRMLALVALTLLCIAASPLAASAAAGSASTAISMDATTAAQYAPDSEDCAFLGLINTYRKQHGLGALTLSKTLGAASFDHSKDMANNNYFDHDSPGGPTWIENIANHGYPSNTARAENIAAGYSSAASTFNQWENSPPHNANMLNGQYKAIGIGRATNANSTYRWYWTTDFGSVVDSTYNCSGSSTGGTTVTKSPSGTLYKPVGGGHTASSSASTVTFDGSLSTTWTTTGSTIQTAAYFYVDLGAVRNIEKIKWYLSKTGGADVLDIRVSNDKSTWTTIRTTKNGTGGSWKTLLWTGNARYVMFYFENPNHDKVLGYVAEVQVYA
jgi:uncharacterized protein YkwD